MAPTPVPLPPDLLDLLRAASTCYLVTLLADGSPQVTQTWVDTDGQHILVNSVQTHVKVRNIARDPRVGRSQVRVLLTIEPHAIRPAP